MSGDYGFKVSKPGVDVTTASIENLVVDSNYPVAKCDLRKTPQNFGLINILISSLAANSTITVYQQPHGYNYIPQFLTAWSFPRGTNPLSQFGPNATFGIGDVNANFELGLTIVMYTDNTNFTITAHNSSLSSPIAGISLTVRFYIFADDFSDI